MCKIILKGFITVSEEDMTGVLAELPKHIELTREESGCLIFNVTRDEDNRSRFNVYEEFIDKESFEQNKKRVSTSVWGKVTKNVGRSYEIEGL